MKLTLTVDAPQVIAALRKRSAHAVELRAQKLADQGAVNVKQLITSEVKRSGHSQRRGMTSLHDIPIEGSVESAGDLPIIATVRAVCDGETAAKFAAHNYGAGQHDIGGAPTLSFPGTGDREGQQVVVRKITHPGTPGKDWLKRGFGLAVARMKAGFIR